MTLTIRSFRDFAPGALNKKAGRGMLDMWSLHAAYQYTHSYVHISACNKQIITSWRDDNQHVHINTFAKSQTAYPYENVFEKSNIFICIYNHKYTFAN